MPIIFLPIGTASGEETRYMAELFRLRIELCNCKRL